MWRTDCFFRPDYPDLEGDEARRSIWLVDVPLAATHHLRNSINTGKAIPREVLERYEIPIVASVLKLYLLELPGEFSDGLSACLSIANRRSFQIPSSRHRFTRLLKPSI